MPMSRIFTHVESVEINDCGAVETRNSARHEFKGFDRHFLPLSNLDYVAVVLIDGETEIWAVDGKDGAAALHQYLCEFGGGDVQIAGVYKRM